MTRRWIRLDAEWEESGWVAALPGQSRGCWPRLLCWVKLRGKRGRCRWPDHAVLADHWSVPRRAVDVMLEGALGDGAVRRDESELVVVKWADYQEPDATATERKRRQRRHLEGVTPESRRDNRDIPRDPSRDHRPPTEELKEPLVRRRRRKPETELPESWTPSESHQQKARAAGLDLGRESERFRAHHTAKGSLFRDWGMAFHTWLDNAVEWRQKPKSSRVAPPLQRLTREAS